MLRRDHCSNMHIYWLVHGHHQVLKNWPQTAFVLGPEDDHSQNRHGETSLPVVPEYQHQTCCSATRQSKWNFISLTQCTTTATISHQTANSVIKIVKLILKPVFDWWPIFLFLSSMSRSRDRILAYQEFLVTHYPGSYILYPRGNNY